MMLYGHELETPLDLITHPSSDGVDEPGVPYPETLRASLQEAHDHARLALDHSHNRQKHYYDLRCHPASYAVGDLVRVKNHPRSDAQSNFTAKLAPLFTGPLRVSQKLGDVNYRLTRLGTGMDAGVFHVVNLQPFHTWDSASSSGHAVPVTVGHSDPGTLNEGVPLSQADSQTGLPDADMCFHVPGDSDTGPAPAMDCDSENCSTVSVSDPYPNHSGRYDLRPRHHPRITSGWSASKWTNSYYTDRFDLK